jgi:8-oxo-dGTP diphosphatase
MAPKPFSLSVKVVVRDASGRVLALRRSATSRANSGKWEFPGGKVDAGEAFDAALVREVREETGLEVELDHVLGAAESDLPARRVAYLLLGASSASGQVRLSDEHDEFRWLAASELGALDFCPQFRELARSLSGSGVRVG